MKAPKHETCFKLAVFKQRHDEFLPRPHIYGLEIIINVRCQLKICNFKVTMDVLRVKQRPSKRYVVNGR